MSFRDAGEEPHTKVTKVTKVEGATADYADVADGGQEKQNRFLHPSHPHNPRLKIQNALGQDMACRATAGGTDLGRSETTPS